MRRGMPKDLPFESNHESDLAPGACGILVPDCSRPMPGHRNAKRGEPGKNPRQFPAGNFKFLQTWPHIAGALIGDDLSIAHRSPSSPRCEVPGEPCRSRRNEQIDRSALISAM